jgi:hypothetical protein
MDGNLTSAQIFQDAWKKGVILGTIHVVLFILLYVFAPGKLTGFSTLTLTIAINFFVIIYDSSKWRAKIGGFMTYGAAFKYALVMFVFNGLTTLIFMIIFILLIPDFPELMANSQIDTSIYWAQKFGAPGEMVDKMREDMNIEKIKGQFGFLGQLKVFGILLLFYVLGSSIIALITRKNEPEIL